MTTPYPLAWPPMMPRTVRREQSRFKVTLAGALKNVQDSLRKFGSDSRKPIKDIVLSSNCTLGRERPDDPGVAAWFNWDGEQFCIPVDRYTTPAENLQAIHHVIEARRVELRHGTLALVKATFRGFKALPAPASARPWRAVLDWRDDNLPTQAEIDAQFRSLARTKHPDRGGSTDEMAELNAARDEALRAIGATD